MTHPGEYLDAVASAVSKSLTFQRAMIDAAAQSRARKDQENNTGGAGGENNGNTAVSPQR